MPLSNDLSKSGKCETRVEFRKDGYDPFIDFLKGWCIACVVLNHCANMHDRNLMLFPFWGSPAVPIFLMIQVFHTYKRGVDNVSVNWNKLWKRIIKPFVFVELIILALHMAYTIRHDQSITENLLGYLKLGGMGPGSYYIWIYIQFAVILAFISPLFKRLKSTQLIILFIIVSELIEIICCLTNMPTKMYRIGFFRYTMLIGIGYIVAKKGILVNKYTLVVSLLSLITLYIFSYFKPNLQPLIFNRWEKAHWMQYFYMVFLLIPIIYWIYERLQKWSPLTTFVKLTGRYSYEIYLFQMLYFFVATRYVDIEHIPLTSRIAFVVVSMVVCIVPIVWIKNKKSKDKMNA